MDRLKGLISRANSERCLRSTTFDKVMNSANDNIWLPYTVWQSNIVQR